MAQLELFHRHVYVEPERSKVERMLEGSHIAIVTRSFGWHGSAHYRWECQRCGRGGMWLGGPSWPRPDTITYALTKHRCRHVEADNANGPVSGAVGSVAVGSP